MPYWDKHYRHVMKPPIGATIDFGHPLAQGMLVCLTAGEGGGPLVDLVSRNTIALGSGVRGNFRFGHGINLASATGGASATAWSGLKSIAQEATVLFRGEVDSGGDGFSSLFGVAYSNPAADPFYCYFLDRGSAGSTVRINWNSGGVQNNLAGTPTAYDGSERQYVGIIRGSVGLTELYEITSSGLLTLLNSTTPNFGPNFTASSHIDVGGGSGLNAKIRFRHGYIWGRALTRSEIQELWVAPYSFLKKSGKSIITIASTDISPTGIASAEAWGTPSISAPIGLTGIPSAEAWGTPSIDTSRLVLPTGIPSAEAWGTPSIEGTVAVSPTGIPSAEALGHPTIAQSQKSRVLVGGFNRTDYLHHESQFSWNMLKGSRGSCSIPLVVPPGDEFAPAVGQFIEIFDPVDVRVWAGTVEQVFTRWFGDDGWHLFVVTGVTLDSLFDAAFVDKTVFDGVTGGDAFTDLFTAAGVSQVSLGTVETGETITALEVTRISDGFSSIALRSNMVWFIDPADLTLNLVSTVARAAPWVMASEDMVWESMQWRQSRADFRDTQVIQSPDGTTQTIVAVTGNDSIGRRTARLTITTSNTNPGAIEEATAVLRRFSTLPSQLVVSTDRPGVSVGMLLEIDVDDPVEASGLLNGFWQVVEVEAVMLTGMDAVDPSLRRVAPDLSLGHFRYTLHLVNSLATAIFQGDGVTTVFTLPVTPTSVSSIRVAPNGGLYSTGSAGALVTITPAMPPGTNGTVNYDGLGSPDVGTFLDMWKAMSPVAASAGPASGGGSSAQRYIADATLRDLTVQDDAGPHAIVYHAGTGVRALVVLRQLLGADLIVRFNLDGNPLVTLVIDSGTAVDTVLEFPLSARKFTVTIASPGVVTLEDGALADDDAVVLHTTGALPTGLVDGNTYYVVSSAGSTFELAATLGGTPIDTSGTQSGNHWLTSPALGAPAFADKDVLTYDILDSDGAIDTTPGGIANITLEWE